jgi:single-stranded-DNA-specific exonuclease
MRTDDETKISKFTQQGLSQTTAQILAGRDVEPTDAEKFLNPTLRQYLPDPSVLVDMDRAATRIVDAVEAGEAITVFADYDVDGGTSAAQLIRWGRTLGAKFGLYVPDRVKEGYGPSAAAFEELKKSGADLVITVDCGASAEDALTTAAEIDLPIIVIDHHMMSGEMPPAFALVNPNRSDDISGLGHLAAAGVTFMLLVALNREAKRRGIKNTPDLLSLLDLTALGTICDVVPLTGLNRAFVAQGLKVLSNKPNLGLKKLAEIAGSSAPFTTYHGGFILGPRINAGGRIGQADMGACMLSSDDADEVEGFAVELDRINKERRQIQDRIFLEALEQVEQIPGFDSPNGPQVICIAMQGWHAGVIGIVAGRLKDRFNRPAIVIGVDTHGIGKGSGRSMYGVDMGTAIIDARKQGILDAGGGHAMAAGLTIAEEKIPEFQMFIDNYLREYVIEARKNSALKIDALLSPSAVGIDLIKEIDRVGPYGAKMPEPLFAFADLRVTFAQRLNGGHVRCAFEDNSGTRLAGIAFRAEETGIADVLLAPNPPHVHIAARLKENNWKGRTKIDMQISDLAIAG